MLPSRHIIVSFSLGATVWLYTHSALGGLLCFLSGVLIDIDHLIEYVIHYGLKGFNLRQTYQTCGKLAESERNGGVKKLYLVFHAGEFAILLWAIVLLTKNIYLLSIAIGYTGHLIMDASANVIKPHFYFLTLRMINEFNTSSFIKND